MKYLLKYDFLNLLSKAHFLLVFLLFINISVKSQSETSPKGLTQEQILLYNNAVEYLSKYKPDIALPILYDLLDSVTPKSDYCIKIKISISEGYRMKKETGKGIELLKSLLLIKNLSNENRAHIYNRLAALNGYDGEEGCEATIRYSNLCIELAEQLGDKDLIASSRNELGYIYMKESKLVEAEEYYTKAYQHYIKAKKNVYAANVAINLSKIYLNKVDYEKAQNIVDTVMSLLNEDDYKNMFMRLYLQKAVVYEYWGKFDSAYKYVSLGRVAQKHYFLDRMDDQVFEMNAKYELQQKENEVFEARMLKEKQQKENYFLIIIIVVLLIVVIAILIFLYLKKLSGIQKNKIDEYEKKLLKNKIDNKNKDLSNAIAHAYAYNNSLQLIKDTLLTKTQKETLKAINLAINTDYNWVRFITTFNELKPNFFLNLEEKHANITESEKKLAALLSMKLTSKEISGILNVELSTVSKSRQRLRKKLNIKTEANLNDYFNQF